MTNDAEEQTYLEQYFGQPPDEYQRARFFLMRQVLRMFYATVFLLLGSAGKPISQSVEPALIQRLSSADLGGRGQPGGQRSEDRLWHGSLGTALTEYAAITI